MAGKTKDVATVSKYEEFVAFVQAKAAEAQPAQLADDLASEQVTKIAVAEDLDSVFGAMRMQGLTGLRDLDAGTELDLLSYRLVQSTREDMAGKTGAYAIIDAVNLYTGERVALDTGIERILVFLIKCDQLNAFPVQVKIVKKTTGSGNETITLGPVSKRDPS